MPLASNLVSSGLAMLRRSPRGPQPLLTASPSTLRSDDALRLTANTSAPDVASDSKGRPDFGV